jgi:hypothetical protein
MGRSYALGGRSFFEQDKIWRFILYLFAVHIICCLCTELLHSIETTYL